MEYAELLAGLEEQLKGKTPNEVSEDGVCRFAVGDVAVELRDVDEISSAALSVKIGKLGEAERTSVEKALLRASFMGQQTGGARVALTDEAELSLETELSYRRYDASAFAVTLGRLVGIASVWRQALDEFDRTAGKRSAAAEASRKLRRRLLASEFLRA